MVVLDATVVNVALPSIQSDLEMSEADLQWIVNAYTLVFGGFLLLGGRAGDLIGRKRVFLAGVVIFTVASLLNGLATSSEMLIVSRGLQGLGGALVSPAALSILNTSFESERDRTKALGGWSAIAAGGGAVGLVLGGALTDWFSWPWIFFVNLPIGVIAFVLSARLVPESKAETKERSFDIGGAISVTAGLIVLVFAIVRTSSVGWGSWQTIVGFVGAVALLAAFVLIERRAKAPLVRLDIFSVPTLRAANLTMVAIMAGLFAMFFFNTLYMQRVLGYSALKTGVAFVPFPVGIVIGAGLAQTLIRQRGTRTVTLIGAAFSVLGMFWLVRLDVDSSYAADLLPSILVTSIAMGLTFVPLTLIGTGGLPNEDAGLVSGLFNTSQQVGGAIGLAALSTVSASRIDDRLAGAGADPSTGEQLSALVHGFKGAFAGAAILVAAGGLLFLALLRKRHVDAGTAQATEPATESRSG
ncbi:MAG: MFS transporter [Actinobacteria bacterium]|nr:MFS transporter [Actinomycetota bacterium]